MTGRGPTGPLLLLVCVTASLAGPAVEPRSAASTLVEELESDQTPVWREAQVRLVGTGSTMLGPLDALATGPGADDAETRRRIATVLAVSLLVSVPWDEVREREGLARVAKPYVDQGRALAAMLAKRKALDIGEPPLLPPGVEYEPSGVAADLRKLRSLSGFGVPAATDLLSDPSPVARAYGILLLTNSRAIIAAKAIQTLQSDKAEVGVIGSDWTSRETVGERARQALSRLSNREPRVAFTIENIITRIDLWNGAYDGLFDLINGIRQTSNAPDATSWDEWWTESRPVWRTWWRMAGEGPRPPEREDWLNYLRRKEGFSLRRTPHPDGGSRLVLSLPDGARHRVYFDDELRSEGTGDLLLEGSPRQSLKIVVAHADGRIWEKTLVSNAGQIFAVRVFEPEQ